MRSPPSSPARAKARRRRAWPASGSNIASPSSPTPPSASRSSSRSARSSRGPTRFCPPCSPTRTRRAWSSTTPLCSTGASIPASTASRAARAPITASSTSNNLPSGGHVNVVAGQSVQIAGQNSYTLVDATNTGLESGLDKRWSNFVAGETFQPTAAPLTLGLKQQFDSSNLSLARFDAILGGTWGGFVGSFDYANYAAQPLLGWAFPREGFITKASYKFENGLTVSGGLTRRHVAPLLRPGLRLALLPHAI